MERKVSLIAMGAGLGRGQRIEGGLIVCIKFLLMTIALQNTFYEQLGIGHRQLFK